MNSWSNRNPGIWMRTGVPSFTFRGAAIVTPSRGVTPEAVGLGALGPQQSVHAQYAVTIAENPLIVPLFGLPRHVLRGRLPDKGAPRDCYPNPRGSVKTPTRNYPLEQFGDRFLCLRRCLYSLVCVVLAVTGKISGSKGLLRSVKATTFIVVNISEYDPVRSLGGFFESHWRVGGPVARLHMGVGELQIFGFTENYAVATSDNVGDFHAPQ